MLVLDAILILASIFASNSAQPPLHFWPKLTNLLFLRLSTFGVGCFSDFDCVFSDFSDFDCFSRLCFPGIEPILLT